MFKENKVRKHENFSCFIQVCLKPAALTLQVWLAIAKFFSFLRENLSMTARARHPIWYQNKPGLSLSYRVSTECMCLMNLYVLA